MAWPELVFLEATFNKLRDSNSGQSLSFSTTATQAINDDYPFSFTMSLFQPYPSLGD